jgi:nicotinate-nucleotide adenylyltransferase
LTTAQAQRSIAARHQPRRIALFGGSFDPIHNGHLAVARAADRRFNFDEIHFIPASRPPHKLKQHLAPFPHRYAMVALACDRIFFIIGADAFLDIPVWKEYESLLGLCDFIIANRPGIRAEALKLVIPPDLMAAPNARRDPDPPPSQLIAQLRRTNVYLLENVSSDVSATDVRRRAHKGQAIHGLVSARVEEYIHKQGLYS